MQTLSLYKIWRSAKGSSLKRWLSDEQVARYKANHPTYRLLKIQAVQQSRPAAPACPSQRHYIYGWGRHTSELYDKTRQTGNPTISYDDILDTLLAAGKGI